MSKHEPASFGIEPVWWAQAMNKWRDGGLWHLEKDEAGSGLACGAKPFSTAGSCHTTSFMIGRRCKTCEKTAAKQEDREGEV